MRLLLLFVFGCGSGPAARGDGGREVDAPVDRDAGSAPVPDAGSVTLPGEPVLLGETRLLEAAPSSLVRMPDVVYDADDDVYAIVHGQGPVAARVVSRDGEPIGAPLVVPENASSPGDRSWSQSPRIAYAPAHRLFLATWADARNDPDRPEIWARFVRFTGAALEPVDRDFQVSGPGVFHESEPALAFVPSANLFVVTWIEAGVRVRGVRLDGTMTDPVVLASEGWFEKTAVVVAGESIVVTVARAIGEVASVSAFVLDSSLALTGETPLSTGVSGTKVNDLAFDSSRVLAIWWEATPAAARFASTFLAPGSAPSDAVTLFPGYQSYDGLALAYSAPADSYLAIFHGRSNEDEGALVGPDGTAGEPFIVTRTGDMNGNFNPRVAASTREPRFLVVTSHMYSHLAIQLVGVE
jgi:hypothetical protein